MIWTLKFFHDHSLRAKFNSKISNNWMKIRWNFGFNGVHLPCVFTRVVFTHAYYDWTSWIVTSVATVAVGTTMIFGVILWCFFIFVVFCFILFYFVVFEFLCCRRACCFYLIFLSCEFFLVHSSTVVAIKPFACTHRSSRLS